MTMINRRRSMVALLGVALTTGCGLLDTETPNVIDPNQLDTPAAAEALRLGALADFAFVKDGDGTQTQDGLILVSGLLSDEFIFSTTPPSEQEIDQRTTALINPSLSDVYANLHKARAGLEKAGASLQQFLVVPDSSPEIPEMQSLAGLTYVYFGEDFCNGVPFSRISGDSLIFGTGQTNTQMFETAVAKFDSALAHPGLQQDDGTITNLALVGRARALVDLGRFDEAAAAVVDVPTDFQYVSEHAEAPLSLQNAIWSYTDQGLWSVADSEGGVGLPYVTSQDPRVPTDTLRDEDGNPTFGLDNQTIQILLLKYPDANASVVVADGIEARLIEAEAQLQTNNFNGMRATLNTLRGTIGMPNLPTVSTRDAAIDVLFSERAFWLYATGHRLGDMRRLIRQYLRLPDAVFPTGAYHKGSGTLYGSDVNLPIPIEEQNNPNGGTCTDRNA